MGRPNNVKFCRRVIRGQGNKSRRQTKVSRCWVSGLSESRPTPPLREVVLLLKSLPTEQGKSESDPEERRDRKEDTGEGGKG